MAMLNETVSPRHDLASIVNDLIDKGQQREALALMLFSDAFGKATNGHAQMEPDRIDALFAEATLTAQDIRRAVETYIPTFFAAVAPPEKEKPAEIKPSAELETKLATLSEPTLEPTPVPARAIVLPAFASAARETATVRKFATKPIFALFPHLRGVLEQAGLPGQTFIVQALIASQMKPSYANSMTSNYLNLKEHADQTHYPFATVTGARLKKIILEKLGQEAVDFAELNVGESPKAPEEQVAEEIVEKPTEVVAAPPAPKAPTEPDSQNTSEENPFADKAISKKFPNLGIVLARAGIKRPGDISRKLQALGLTEGSSTVATAQYLGCREKTPSDSPFSSATGRKLKQAILDTLGADAVAFAEQRTTVPASVDTPIDISFAQAAPTITEAIEIVSPAVKAPTPVKAAPPLPPASPQAPQPKPERTYSSANNFFAAFYQGKRIAPEDVQTDIHLTAILREAGIPSYEDLLQRRQQGKLTLDLRNNEIEKLQKRAKLLGINAELCAGEFRAGKTTAPPPPPPKPAVSAEIRRAHAEFEQSRREAVPIYEEKPRAARPFSALVLSELTPHEKTLLISFMNKLKQLSMVQNAVRRRVMDQPISTGVLAEMSLYTTLFKTQQPPRVAQAQANQLVAMGVITDKPSQGIRVTPAFLARFTELYDWSVVNDKSAGDLYGREVNPAPPRPPKPGPR